MSEDVEESTQQSLDAAKNEQAGEENEFADSDNSEVIIRIELHVKFPSEAPPATLNEDDNNDSSSTTQAATASKSIVDSKFALYSKIPVVGDVACAAPLRVPSELDADNKMTLSTQAIVKADKTFLKSLASSGDQTEKEASSFDQHKLSMSIFVTRESINIGEFLYKDSFDLSSEFLRVLFGETSMTKKLTRTSSTIAELPQTLFDASEASVKITLSKVLLNPSIKKELLPVAITVKKVEHLPDQPATMQQLDKCHPIRIKYKFMTKELGIVTGCGFDSERCYTATSVSEWKQLMHHIETSPTKKSSVKHQIDNAATTAVAHSTKDSKQQSKGKAASHDKITDTLPLHVRDAEFGFTDLFLFGLIPEEKRVEFFTRMTFTASVFDRTAKIKPVSAIASSSTQSSASKNDNGEEEVNDVVYGSATGSLLPLVSGAKQFDIDLLLHATTTIQGGDLEWKTRPGRYTEAGSTLIMEALALYPVTSSLPSPASHSQNEASFKLKKTTLTTEYNHISRAVFILHYQDTSLLQKLQNVLRSTNAKKLNLEGSHDHILRTLKTYKLQQHQLEDNNLDIITGFQLIDNARRIIMLEGLSSGNAMQLVKEIATQALSHDQQQRKQHISLSSHDDHETEVESFTTAAGNPIDSDQSNDLFELSSDSTLSESQQQQHRKVLINLDIRYPYRLYGSMVGADLWPLKLRSNLMKISKDPVMCGKRIRPSCVEGLRRLSNIHLCTWMRDIDRMNLWPTEEMLKVVDKKFGGEITKFDLGEAESDNKGKSRNRNINTLDVMMKSFNSIIIEGENKLDGSRCDMDIAKEELEKAPKPEVDQSIQQGSRMKTSSTLQDLMKNPEYIKVKAEKTLERSKRNFKNDHEKFMDSLKPKSQSIRSTWQEWNPVRVRYSGDDMMVESQTGKIGEKTMDLAADHNAGGEAEDNTMHEDPFRWPPARRTSEYARHPKRPTDARIEELRCPWVENEYNNTYNNNSNSNNNFAVPFHTNVVRGSGQLFERDPKYFTSVHLCGDGLIREQMEARKREEEEFRSKIVVDDIHFKSVIMSRVMPSQTDRHRSMLIDSPVKRGLKPDKKLEPVPICMRISLPHEEADKTILERKDERSKFKGKNHEDFVRHIKSNQSMVHTRK